jgi:hypothetical protein
MKIFLLVVNYVIVDLQVLGSAIEFLIRLVLSNGIIFSR